MSNESRPKVDMALELTTRGTATKVIESLMLFLLTIASLLGNTLILLAAYRKQRLRKSFYTYIISLAVSDIIMAAVTMPLACLSVMKGKWDLGFLPCQIQGFVVACCGFESVLLMCLIAVSRYFKMIHSSLYAKIFTPRFFHISNACSWILMATAFLINTMFVEFAFNPGIILCSLNFDKIPLILVYWVLFYSLNYSIIYFCYFKIWRFVRNHNNAMANSQVRADEVNTIRILFVVVLAFTFSVSPLFTCGIVDAILGLYSLPRQVYVVSVLFYGLSCCVNPVIYGIMNQVFRQEFKKILCSFSCCPRKTSTTTKVYTVQSQLNRPSQERKTN